MVIDTDDVDSGPETKPSDWRGSLDLSHREDEILRDDMLSMLAKHEDMRRPCHLGYITATEHRIEIVLGTKPIRQTPYRQRHRVQDVQAEEIAKMLEAGVIEPASREWASPVVPLPKRDAWLLL